MPETVHARCRLPHKAYFGAGTRGPAGTGRGGWAGLCSFGAGLRRDFPGGGGGRSYAGGEIHSPADGSGGATPLLEILLRDLIADALRINRRLAEIETCLE